MGYYIDNEEKWSAVKALFPWATDGVIAKAVDKYADGKHSKVIVSEPGKPYNSAERFNIDLDELKYKEDLKPYTWYPKDKFDGNPNNYWLLCKTIDGTLYSFVVTINSLYSDTEYFMYIDRLN